MKYPSAQPRARKSNGDPFVIHRGRFGPGRLNSAYRTKWAEDVVPENGREGATVGNSFNYGALPLIGLAVFLLMSLLVGRSAYLQIVKGEYYYSLAEGNRIRIERVEPKRGVIYDRAGRPLVRNQANFMLYFIPADMPRDPSARRAIFDSIAASVEALPAEALEERYSEVPLKSLEAYRPLFIADRIPYEPAVRLMLESDGWPGVFLSSKNNRSYPAYADAAAGEEPALSRHSLSHVIGYTGKISESELERYGEEYLPIDYIGKMGIEYFWENELKGQGGKKHIEVDALGKEKKIIRQVEPVDGRNLVLSIDARQQLKLESLLAAQLEKLGKSKGLSIALDPRNGEILALVSLPSYDNNLFARGISGADYEALIGHPDKPLFNRAVSGEYPSGSTIKPVWAAAALEDGVVSEHTAFLSTGGIRIGQWFFPDWRAGGHGRVDVRRAIAESVNTYFYNIGGGYEGFSGLGVDRLAYYGGLFGLGRQTGVDLAGEASGFVPTKEWKKERKGESWYIGDTYHLSIGQGDLLVTPLQVAAYTAVFANGGRLYRPHFIREILTGDDQPFGQANNEPVRENFISPDNIKVVREGMRQTVTAGSARSLSVLPVASAGKTGTAQWSSQGDTHAWFIGFAPYDEAELVITVLIEEGGEGSDAAVPVARDYLEWYFGEYQDAD